MQTSVRPRGVCTDAIPATVPESTDGGDVSRLSGGTVFGMLGSVVTY